MDQPRHAVTARSIAARGIGPAPQQGTALLPPMDMASTYLRDPDNGYSAGSVYGRADNASVRHAERQVALMEQAHAGLLFSSGMAAATAVFTAMAPTHIVAPTIMFWGLRDWLHDIARHGHSITYVDMSNLPAVAGAIRPGETGLVWIETPSNPLWTITDIEAVAGIAHRAGAILCADSTAATPVLTRPLTLGADIVMHSATKYLNGHSDVVAGVLAAARPSALWTRIGALRAQIGSAASPFDAWLLARGLRTLHLRMREHCRTGQFLAEALDGHPAIAEVLYPGLPRHPGHAVARRQMEGGFGGMLSLRLRGGEEAAIAVAAGVELWQRATSFGGVESLIEHRASIEGAGSPCPDDLLRLSAGLEDPDDLLRDLHRALASLG
ncbi:trans-sulfuration enzyme family protein [Plastoroseomonas arctica]|uniref:Aminotransferase class V-fold PLP-dependent enzyme n=1 Tax=Plastoroseomonas arctica TaxID=1509237 RepID=A0AAF1K656_9PROT|nr:PLP-dependent transferase [Plastoroseomonas arctica]MBR0656844.1 aminotransferase class V-fold PLP-dependent enzyme [Plastoroseomonas arctica]